MRHGIREKKQKQAMLAKERIQKLFDEAEKANPGLAKRYVTMARKIATRTNTRVPKEFRLKFCKECNAFLIPGKNARIRTKNMKIIMGCLECGHQKQLPFAREKQKKG